MTGVVYRVSTWLNIRPPTIAMPSGRRSSEPVPVPRASGTPPRMAAMVVMRMGRKRSRHAWLIAFPALGIEREVNHHNAVLLHNADEQDHADEGDDAQIGVA